MSTISQLGILGIRSFGPDAADMQHVKFFKPLTLILGPNGTGKTTIIECLKYAATGDMPPGSKGASGGNFVHDPKLAKEREIKAQVKLMIKDITGATCVVERSMVSRVKDGKFSADPRNSAVAKYSRNPLRGSRQIPVIELQTAVCRANRKLACWLMKNEIGGRHGYSLICSEAK
ncbi:DNA repair protein RAD50 [Elysia marginata]|uniref:DNA repair protein RAD50 n=1 Tax=Elysia marginata TaxID=1093978 RepID=A0AAV4J8N3_9GAST|nr:DNA repair protein RAD50 [Elysia marginata]